MKKEVLIFLLVIALSTFTTAIDYSCDGTLNEDIEEIEKGTRGSINGLGIALADSDFAAIINRVAAELILDAEKVSLTNQSNNTNIELKSGDYDITFNSATDSLATIDVDGSSKEIGEGEIETIGGLKIYLIEAEAYPATVEILAGTDDLALSNDDTLSKLVDIEEKDYFIELLSASDSDALIKVSKCNNGNFTEIETPEPVEEENETEQNDTQIDINITQNDTIEDTTEINETEQNDTVQEPACLTDNTLNGKYCNTEGQYVELKDAGETCSAEYECTTGKCKSGECAKDGIFSRFFRWLGNLFG